MGSLVDKETYKVLSYLKNQGVNLFGSKLDDNSAVGSYNYGGGQNEKWIVTKEADGYFSFTPRCLPQGGTRKVLDASQTSIGKLIIYTHSGADNQLWAVEPVDASGYLAFIRSKKGGYLQYNADNQEISVVAKTGAKNQQWSFQELSTVTCQDGAWFDSLTSLAREAELKRIELERIERERIERETLERERIQREKLAESERLEHERIERERLERERLEKERADADRLEREKREADLAEIERKLKEQEERFNKLQQDQARQAEQDLAEREKLIDERKRQILILQLEQREKQLKDREAWLQGRNKTQTELREVLVIIRTSTDPATLKKAREDKDRLEIELREFDRTEQQLGIKEKFMKEQLDKLEVTKKQKEAELDALMLKNRADGLRAWELWLIQLEAEVKRIVNVKITYVIRNVAVEEPSDNVHSTTTHSSSVELIGGERVTRNVEVTETERVVKSYEYRPAK